MNIIQIKDKIEFVCRCINCVEYYQTPCIKNCIHYPKLLEISQETAQPGLIDMKGRLLYLLYQEQPMSGIFKSDYRNRRIPCEGSPVDVSDTYTLTDAAKKAHDEQWCKVFESKTKPKSKHRPKPKPEPEPEPTPKPMLKNRSRQIKADILLEESINKNKHNKCKLSQYEIDEMRHPSTSMCATMSIPNHRSLIGVTRFSGMTRQWRRPEYLPYADDFSDDGFILKRFKRQQEYVDYHEDYLEIVQKVVFNEDMED